MQETALRTLRHLIMRAVIQRVKESSVSVNNGIVGKTGKGLLVLLGVSESDRPGDADYLSEKIINLRMMVS